MDAKPADEFELEERHDADAYDDFVETLPDESEETETSLDDLSTIKSDLEKANISAEVDKFYKSFPNYDADGLLIIRNKNSLQPKTNRLRNKFKGKYFDFSSERYPYNFLTLSTIASNYGPGGAAFIRDDLVFTDYTSGGAKPKIPPPVEARAIDVNQTTP